MLKTTRRAYSTAMIGAALVMLRDPRFSPEHTLACAEKSRATYLVGVPTNILRMFEERREIVGDFELATSFRFGGTPYQFAEDGLKLYCKEVLPVLKSWKSETLAKAAE